MKIIFLVLLASFVLLGCGGSSENPFKPAADSLQPIPENEIVQPADSDRYGFQTGMVMYTSTTFGITQYITTWFSDFGRINCTEIKSTVLGQRSHHMSLIRDSVLYNIDMIGKTGTWKLIAQNDTTEEPNYRYMTDEELIAKNITMLPEEVFMGKKCRVFDMKSVVDGMEVLARVWVWEGIPLKTVSTVSGMEVSMEATEIKVNVRIPDSKFIVPKGITLTENTDSLKPV